MEHNTTQYTAHRAREALRSCLPELLRNPQFTGTLKNDETTRRWGSGRGVAEAVLGDLGGRNWRWEGTTS